MDDDGNVDNSKVNVMYDALVHPLLGDINSIKVRILFTNTSMRRIDVISFSQTLRPIKEGEELFVDYGYDSDDELLKRMQSIARSRKTKKNRK